MTFKPSEGRRFHNNEHLAKSKSLILDSYERLLLVTFQTSFYGNFKVLFKSMCRYVLWFFKENLKEFLRNLLASLISLSLI